MTKPMSTTFLEVDNISNGESGTSEVTAFLLNPSPLLSTAETTGNTVTDNLLLTVGDHLSRQLTTPLVQLLIGQLRPNRPGTKTMYGFVRIRNVADQIISRRDKRNRIINHAKKILATKSPVKTFFKFFSSKFTGTIWTPGQTNKPAHKGSWAVLARFKPSVSG
jgi:hypothetical protein